MNDDHLDPDTSHQPSQGDPHASRAPQATGPQHPLHVAGAAIGAQAARAAHGVGIPGGAAGTATAAGPAPRKKGVLARIVSLLSALVVAAMVWGGIHYFTDKAKESDTMKTGNCVTVTKGSGNASDTPAKIDCGDTSKPSFQVVKRVKGDSCPKNYRSFNYMDPNDKEKVSYTYCLMDNLASGSCYKESSGQTAGTLVGSTKVECSASDAEFMVAQVLYKDSTAKCAAGQEAVEYTDDPVRTYCLAAPQ